MSSLPGYDAWKLASPYDMTAAEEQALEDRLQAEEDELRAAIADALPHRHNTALSHVDIRQIVLDELAKWEAR
jgi:hypothetical protein